MRTGILHESISSRGTTEFLRKVEILLLMLAEYATDTGARLARITGRSRISHHMMVCALRYECHHFFERAGLEDRFIQLMGEPADEEEGEEGEEGEAGGGGEEGEGGEEGGEEEEEEGEEEGEEGGEEGEEEEGDSGVFAALSGASSEDEMFLSTVLQITKGWAEWDPDDPVQSLLKRSLDAADQKCRPRPRS